MGRVALIFEIGLVPKALLLSLAGDLPTDEAFIGLVYAFSRTIETHISPPYMIGLSTARTL
jgi:hypothetical protein